MRINPLPLDSGWDDRACLGTVVALGRVDHISHVLADLQFVEAVACDAVAMEINFLTGGSFQKTIVTLGEYARDAAG